MGEDDMIGMGYWHEQQEEKERDFTFECKSVCKLFPICSRRKTVMPGNCPYYEVKVLTKTKKIPQLSKLQKKYWCIVFIEIIVFVIALLIIVFWWKI